MSQVVHSGRVPAPYAGVDVQAFRVQGGGNEKKEDTAIGQGHLSRFEEGRALIEVRFIYQASSSNAVWCFFYAHASCASCGFVHNLRVLRVASGKHVFSCFYLREYS